MTESEMRKLLCGTWRSGHFPAITWTYNADGTGSASFGRDGGGPSSPIAWRLEGDRMKFWDTSGQSFPELATELNPDQQDIVSVDDQTLVILPCDSDGRPTVQLTMYRVSEVESAKGRTLTMPSDDAPQSIDFRLERTIHVRRGGPETSGPVTVGPIRWLPERKVWACFWSIHIIHPEEARLYGDDPIQALDRTLGFIADLINGSIEDGFEMWWENEGDACGFRS